MSSTPNDSAELAELLSAGLGVRREEALELRGLVVIEHRGPDGELRRRLEVPNLITTIGRAAIMEQLLGSPAGSTKPTHMAVGSGAVAPALGDTALGTELGRVALTSKTRATNVLTMVANFPAGTGTGAITEAGLFDAASAGGLDARATFAVINKGALDTLALTWTWTQT